MEGTVVEDDAGHVVVDCGDCKHWLGGGSSGGLGTKVSVALRPEKIRIHREAPADSGDAPPAPFNRARGRVKDLAYFGSFTVYHLQLESGRILKVSQSNAERQTGSALAWADDAWASWAPLSPVVLTQ